MKRLVVVLIMFAACERRAPDVQPEPRAVTPPTAQEAEVFAKEFAKHMAPCNVPELVRLIDFELLGSRAIAGKGLGANEVAELRKGLGEPTVKNMCISVGPKTTYVYLRTQTINGTPRPLFRMLDDGSYNYQSLELDKQPGGIRVVDIYSYASGETMAQSLATFVDTFLGSQRKAELINAISRLPEIQRLLADGKPRDALAVIERMPRQARALKTVRLVELGAIAALADDAGYAKALDSYAAAFPNDPSLDIFAIDHAMANKQFDKVLPSIHALEKRLGNDPYLDVVLADSRLQAGRTADALALLKGVTEREPGMVQAWWLLLNAQAKAQEFTAAIATLEALRDRFKADVDAATLAGDERFAAIAESKEYAAWARAK